MEKTLVLAGPKPKRVHLRVAGDALEQTTWSAKGVARTTAKPFGSEQEAIAAFHKAVRKKLREDYVYRADQPAPGDVVLEAFAPGGGAGGLLDLSPDGRLVVTASITQESHFGAKLEVVEVETGARRVVLEEPGGVRQNFVHAALFDRAGTGIYVAIRDQTEHVELATGARRVIATASGTNPHVVRPSFDRERRHLCVCGEGATMRVLDDREQIVIEVPTAAPLTECRGAALSPSGRMLALYIASRGIIYHHDDAKHDTTNEVQIWDVESRTLWEVVTVPEQISKLGFTPAEDELVVTWYYALGPVGLAIPTGIRRWHVGDDRGPDQLARTYDWAYSHAGTQLALGGETLRLVDATTRAPLPLEERWGRASGVAFSADGRRVAAALGGTAIVYALG